MTALAKLSLSKEELWNLKLLAKGQVEWEELDSETKEMLYNTPIDLSYKVSNEELREFELKLALKGKKGVTGIGRAAAELAKRKVTG